MFRAAVIRGSSIPGWGPGRRFGEALWPGLCEERNQRIADLGKQRGMGDSVCYGGAIPAQILCATA